MKIVNLLKKEVRVMGLEMIKKLRRRMESQSKKLQEVFFKRIRKYKQQPHRVEEYNN